MNPFPSECRSFLCNLADHLASGAEPQHVRSCRACAERLRAASHQEVLLRRVGRPAVPAALRSPAFLAALHERIAADCEASPLGAAVARVLTPATPPASLPWPEQSLPAHLGDPAADGQPAPARLWSRVRDRILGEVHARRQAHRRLYAASAAAAVLVSAAALQFLSNDGTSEVPEPVLVRVDSPPPGVEFISPGLALQQAAPR